MDIEQQPKDQLHLGVTVTPVSQAGILITRSMRNFKYSITYQFLKKFPLWICVGMLLSILYLVLPYVTDTKIKNASFFTFPGLYNTGTDQLSFVSFANLPYFISTILAINLIVAIVAYFILWQHRSKLSDVILIILCLFNGLVLKTVIQGIWFLHI